MNIDVYDHRVTAFAASVNRLGDMGALASALSCLLSLLGQGRGAGRRLGSPQEIYQIPCLVDNSGRKALTADLEGTISDATIAAQTAKLDKSPFDRCL